MSKAVSTMSREQIDGELTQLIALWTSYGDLIEEAVVRRIRARITMLVNRLVTIL